MLQRVLDFLRYRIIGLRTSAVPRIATFLDYLIFTLSLKRKGCPYFSSPQQVTDIVREINEKGIFIIENYISASEVMEARLEVEQLIANNPRLLSTVAKSDMRLYGAERLSSAIKKFNSDPILEQVATSYNCAKSRAAFTLAAKMTFLEGNLGSGDGWHRDAFLRQFKAILYLTDVSLSNGPFQMIQNSQKINYVMRDIGAGGLEYSQYRISEKQVNLILGNSLERLKTYAAPAGTLILVDTSTIHRGMPILDGERLALTNYYFPEEVISNGLLQKFQVPL